MISGNNVKGEAFFHKLEDYFYIELADKKEKIRKLEKKYTRENEANYNKLRDPKYLEYIKENYFWTKCERVEDEIYHYELIIKTLKELYEIGVSVLRIYRTNIKDIEFIVDFLIENGIKIKACHKKQLPDDINIVKIDDKYRDKLIQAYIDISEGESFKLELDYYSPRTMYKIKEKILICIKDAINNGYCLNHDGLENSWLKYYKAPKPENRASIINILKRYGITFKTDILEGVKGYLKRLYLNYKVKILQIIKRCKKIANFSGGKDSAYMILKALDEGIKFDHIVFADTELEYPEMYSYIDKFEHFIKQDIIRLKPKIKYDDWFYKPFMYGKNEGKIHGFPYVVGDGCWAKRELKIKSIEAFKKSVGGPIVDYIGIAADEPERYKKLILDKQQAPLVDWGITENQCKSELENINLLNPLYCKFTRLGCWLCPKQNLKALKVLFNEYPDLWQKLKIYQKHDFKPFKPNLSVDDLEKKFILSCN